MWGQITQIISSLSPKRDWGSKRVNSAGQRYSAGIDGRRVGYRHAGGSTAVAAVLIYGRHYVVHPLGIFGMYPIRGGPCLNRTYGSHKILYSYLFLPTIFGPIYPRNTLPVKGGHDYVRCQQGTMVKQ